MASTARVLKCGIHSVSPGPTLSMKGTMRIATGGAGEAPQGSPESVGPSPPHGFASRNNPSASRSFSCALGAEPTVYGAVDVTGFEEAITETLDPLRGDAGRLGHVCESTAVHVNRHGPVGVSCFSQLWIRERILSRRRSNRAYRKASALPSLGAV